MKYVSYAVIALVAAIILWRGLLSNSPKPHEETAKSTTGSRGHYLGDSLRTNIPAKPSEGNYPPRALGLAAQSKPPSDSWLLDAESDHERFRRLEVVLRGADIHMLEIGMRFTELHHALSTDAFDMALYEVNQIVRAANIAQLKQPGWHQAQGIDFLGRKQWVVLDGAVKGHDGNAAREAFLEVRKTCMTCHTAQGKDFLNRSDVFEKTASFPTAPVAEGKK